jgi:hypothetical protein
MLSRQAPQMQHTCVVLSKQQQEQDKNTTRCSAPLNTLKAPTTQQKHSQLLIRDSDSYLHALSLARLGLCHLLNGSRINGCQPRLLLLNLSLADLHI